MINDEKTKAKNVGKRMGGGLTAEKSKFEVFQFPSLEFT